MGASRIPTPLGPTTEQQPYHVTGRTIIGPGNIPWTTQLTFPRVLARMTPNLYLRSYHCKRRAQSPRRRSESDSDGRGDDVPCNISFGGRDSPCSLSSVRTCSDASRASPSADDCGDEYCGAFTAAGQDDFASYEGHWCRFLP